MNHVNLIEISQTNLNVSNARKQKVMPKISKCHQEVKKKIWDGNVSAVPSLVISLPKPNDSNVKNQRTLVVVAEVGAPVAKILAAGAEVALVTPSVVGVLETKILR